MGVFFFILGTIVGSFLNVLMYRIPRDLSIVFPSSFCPNCKTPLRPIDLIPVVSFILLRGKCRVCAFPIEWRYPVVEFTTGLLFFLIFQKIGFGWQLVFPWTLVSLLLVIGWIDYEHMIVPVSLTFLGMAVGLLYGLLYGAFLDHVVGWGVGLAVGWLVYWIARWVYRQEAFGSGDPHITGMLGAFCGWSGIGWTLFWAVMAGATISLGLVFLRIKTMKDAIPFGPFLAAAGLWYLVR